MTYFKGQPSSKLPVVCGFSSQLEPSQIAQSQATMMCQIGFMKMFKNLWTMKHLIWRNKWNRSSQKVLVMSIQSLSRLIKTSARKQLGGEGKVQIGRQLSSKPIKLQEE